MKKLQAASKKLDVAFDITPTEGGCQIVSHGQAAHASTPWNGVNAASYLVELLSQVFSKEQLGTFFGFIHEKISLATDGSQIGVQMSDEPSGPLTFNLGLVDVDESQCSLTVDIRYPATKKGSDVTAVLKEQVESCGVEFVLLSDAEPLYLPKESQLVTLLSGAYKDVTGEECDIFSMGGGTYARQMFGKGVAFGASFKDQADSRAHQANEFFGPAPVQAPRGDLPGGHVPDAHRGVSHGTVYPRDPGGHLPQRRGAGLHPTGQRQPGSYWLHRARLCPR